MSPSSASSALRRPLFVALLVMAMVLVAVLFGLAGTVGRLGLLVGLIFAAFVGVPAAMLRGWSRVLGGVGGVVVFVALFALVIRLRYGGGAHYPDLSTAPVIPESGLAPLVALPYPPGNVAVAADGRIFFCYHPFAKAERFVTATVFELVDGTLRPYPDVAFQARYQGVFGMTVDHQHRLWFVEPASLDHPRTRVLAFDLRTNQLVIEYWFPEGEARFAQDLRVSSDGQTLYLADTGLFDFTAPSLLVFDVESRSYRTLLSSHPSTQPQGWLMRTQRGDHKLAYGLISFVVGIDGIDLSADGAWLYYGAMSNDRAYKVPTAALRDARLTRAELEPQIVEVGRKPLSDGIALDRSGNLLLTDIEHGGIARLDPAGRLTTLSKSPAVLWADGVVVAPDGAIVFTDSAIPAYIDQLGRPPTQAALVAGRPYHIYKLVPDAAPAR